jgi:hypothetical protein
MQYDACTETVAIQQGFLLQLMNTKAHMVCQARINTLKNTHTAVEYTSAL